jgi:hypothetical protein
MWLAAGRRSFGMASAAKYQGETMRAHKFEMLRREQRGADDLIADIAKSTYDITSQSAAALAQVCRDIIAGEGSTVAGRKHFSRTIDADDTSLCARILIVAGRTGIAVSRAEADVLFEIDAAGSERCDNGLFDDLLAKAVVHHLMSAVEADIPSREIALAAKNPLDTWASAITLDTESRSWLESHLGEMKHSSAAARMIAAAVSVTPLLRLRSGLPVAVLSDIAA